MLWPRFELILEMNVQSVRSTDPQRLGGLDTRPHYVRQDKGNKGVLKGRALSFTVGLARCPVVLWAWLDIWAHCVRGQCRSARELRVSWALLVRGMGGRSHKG